MSITVLLHHKNEFQISMTLNELKNWTIDSQRLTDSSLANTLLRACQKAGIWGGGSNLAVGGGGYDERAIAREFCGRRVRGVMIDKSQGV